MDYYTMAMDRKAHEAADEFYPREKILEAAVSFRTFASSMDDFLKRNGYGGELDNVDKKVAFIKNAFEQAAISVPRGIREWYTKGKTISRTTAFQICFAFGLNKMETDDFFRRVMLMKGFDCHVMEEAVYYFCIINGKDYADAEQLLNELPKESVPEMTKGRMLFDGDILFTSSIVREIEKFKNEAELLGYFRDNVRKFGYNHAAATEQIQKLWNDIRKPEKGLADQEKVKLQRVDIHAEEPRSVSEILRQIMGLDEVDEEKKPLFVLNSDRSIKPLLKDNPLLPEVAQKQFPNRQTLEKILKGEHVETESIRKTLILTFFYNFWIKKALAQEDEIESNRSDEKGCFLQATNLLAYQAKPGDEGRFMDDINRRLLEVGYPDLYIGNPYDWVFVYCSSSEEPLSVFREFIHDMYLENEEYIIEMNKKNKGRW